MKSSMLENQTVKKGIKFAIFGMVALFFGIDAIMLHRHSYFSETGLYSLDGHVFFYVGLGFIGTLFLAIIATLLRLIFGVKDTYYNDDF
jgi:uncharacterized membrane protein required for colicin V production